MSQTGPWNVKLPENNLQNKCKPAAPSVVGSPVGVHYHNFPNYTQQGPYYNGNDVHCATLPVPKKNAEGSH